VEACENPQLLEIKYGSMLVRREERKVVGQINGPVDNLSIAFRSFENLASCLECSLSSLLGEHA
jgi:hypothetical protein